MKRGISATAELLVHRISTVRLWDRYPRFSCFLMQFGWASASGGLSYRLRYTCLIRFGLIRIRYVAIRYLAAINDSFYRAAYILWEDVCPSVRVVD